jgi:3-deoxy-D-manno-octulosonic-acid transferase
MHAFYSVLSALAMVAAAPWLLWRMARHGKYLGTIEQRLGHLPISLNLDREPSIWIQAVSVGEALTARALIDGLRARYPDHKLFLSTTTRTGQEVARSRLGALDGVFYFPFDWPFAVDRALDVVSPRLFLMMETELWPNMLRACRARGVRTALVSGRISDRSYPRYRLVRPFMRRVLADVDRLLVQSETSAERLVALGAEPQRVVVTGNLKFDALEPPPPGLRARAADRVLRYFTVSPDRTVVIAASTIEGEDLPVLRAFRRIQAYSPTALLILAPRHPERFDAVVRLAAGEGYRVARRTDLAIDTEPQADVVVLDTIGELARLYQVATVVFVGGSLVPAGGHNILEPAAFGRPVVFGPHMKNFAEIANDFLRRHAACQVRDPRELERELVDLVGDPVRRAALGAAARALVDANRGAAERTLDEIAALMPPDVRRRGGSVLEFKRP